MRNFLRSVSNAFLSGIDKAFQGRTGFQQQELKSLKTYIADTTIPDVKVRSEFLNYCHNYNLEPYQIKDVLGEIINHRPLLAQSLLPPAQE